MNGLEVVKPDEQPEKINIEDIRRVIKAWKLLKKIPTEGPRSKGWDTGNYARCARSAKILIATFGDWRKAVECIDFIHTKITDAGFPCSLELVVKRMEDFFEEMSRRGE